MCASSLHAWPIFLFLDRDFVRSIHMAAVYGSAGSEALIVTKDGAVYALGSNVHGCFGTAGILGTFSPKKVENLCGRDIRTFAFGSGPHVLALTKDGEIFSWGHNKHGELGYEMKSETIPFPVLVNVKSTFIDVACGSYHSLALTYDGKVYAWGQNNMGQTSSSSTIETIPKEVSFPENVKNKVARICCGSSWSIAVMQDGSVYSWGCNSSGQLGVGDYGNKGKPYKVCNLYDVIEKVVCGYSHTLALSKTGVLYAWGGNTYGELGLGTKENAHTPRKVKSDAATSVILKVKNEGLKNVTDIAASHYNYTSVAMTKNRNIYLWGHCLGQSLTLPTLIPVTNMYHAFARYASVPVTYQPLLCSSMERDDTLLDCFRKAFNDPVTSDLTVRVQNKDIYVHRAILRICSEHFRGTLEKEAGAEKDGIVIECREFSYNAYKNYFNYLYTDEINAPVNEMRELLELAHAYSEHDLKILCIEEIRTGLTVANVASMYQLAFKLDMEELQKACGEFAAKHMSMIVSTPDFQELNRDTMAAFIREVGLAGGFRS